MSHILILSLPHCKHKRPARPLGRLPEQEPHYDRKGLHRQSSANTFSITGKLYVGLAVCPLGNPTDVSTTPLISWSFIIFILYILICFLPYAYLHHRLSTYRLSLLSLSMQNGALDISCAPFFPTLHSKTFSSSGEKVLL